MKEENKWLFYLGKQDPNDSVLHGESWHIVGNQDFSEVTAMFKTWKEAEEYIKFKNTKTSNKNNQTKV